VRYPQFLKDVIHHKLVEFKKDLGQDEIYDVEAYQKHLMTSKQGRLIQNNRLILQAQTSCGVGRSEESNVDNVILTRQVNEPNLIFNQHKCRDSYYDVDSGFNWRLSDKSECFICQKSKFVMIFY
jgi:hypothetical protein